MRADVVDTYPNLSIQETHLPSNQTTTFVQAHCYKDHVHMSIYKLMSSKGEMKLIQNPTCSPPRCWRQMETPYEGEIGL